MSNLFDPARDARYDDTVYEADLEEVLPVPGYEPERADHDRKRRRTVRRRRAAVVLVLCLALFGGAVFAAWTWIRPLVDGFNQPTDFAGPGTGSVEVTISPGDSGSAIGRTLEEQGVVLTADAFVTATESEPRAASLQPGTYQLQQKMPAADALALLLDPASKISVTVVVREGLWVPEVLAAIAPETGFSVEQLEAALADPALGLPPEAAGNPEGYLFPATYSFEPDVTPVEVLSTMVARHTQAMDEAGVPAEQRRDVLIRASIVQAEGSLPEDLPRIARVIQNRLDDGTALGMDTTVNFALQRRGFDLTTEDLAVDSPYNTRVYPGLPPGPINSPGLAAIEAALTPAEGDWLYFVTVDPDTGETVFTADYDEFLDAKAQFEQWLAENG